MKEFFMESMDKWFEFNLWLPFLISVLAGVLFIIIMGLKTEKQIRKDCPGREIILSGNHWHLLLCRMALFPFLLTVVSIFSYPLFKLFIDEPNKIILHFFQVTPFLYSLFECFWWKKNLVYKDKDTEQKVFG